MLLNLVLHLLAEVLLEQVGAMIRGRLRTAWLNVVLP